MRRIAPLFVASFMFFAVGCEEVVTVEWYDACGGTCLADEVCYEDVVPYCDLASYCELDVCPYDDFGSACVDTYSDPYNCGGCGYYCEGICSFGECQVAGWTCADVGLDDCIDYCADTYTDDNNCGACGNWCIVEAGEFCADGVCQASGTTCEDYGLTTCDTGCADLLTDPYNCGDCGIECVLGCDGAGACN